jgi:TolA-binding protein
VLKEYPTSNKLADAVLKIGLSFERLDDLGEAKKAYAMVTEQYPYSEAAKRAHDRLAKLQ